MARALDNAESDLARKLAFEVRLKRQLEVLDAAIVGEFERIFTRRGIVISPVRFETTLATVLKEHRRAVAKGFSARLRPFLPTPITDAEDLTISTVLADFMDQQATRQARFIAETTTRNMHRALELVNAELAATGEVISASERAARAGGLIRRNLQGRAVHIATFETQSAAEAAKLTEAEVLIGVEPTVRSGRSEPAPLIKRWDSQGDSIVRTTHLAADSQEVNVEDPFIVGGFQLMYPGDSSLGAPLRETAGCRCSGRYNPAEVASIREGRLAA